MKLIVGLGNPTEEYDKTRHNIGFMFIDNFAKKYNLNINIKKFNGLYNKLTLGGETIILLKPQSYMNLSGEVVSKYVNYYKIPIENILIISDDLDLPIGKYKLKSQGSCGGHNGLRNIELNLNTNKYKRLKIGISNNKTLDTKDYVLGRITKDEEQIFNNLLNEINDLLEDYNNISFDLLMTKYNHK